MYICHSCRKKMAGVDVVESHITSQAHWRKENVRVAATMPDAVPLFTTSPPSSNLNWDVNTSCTTKGGRLGGGLGTHRDERPPEFPLRQCLLHRPLPSGRHVQVHGGGMSTATARAVAQHTYRPGEALPTTGTAQLRKKRRVVGWKVIRPAFPSWRWTRTQSAQEAIGRSKPAGAARGGPLRTT